MNPTPAGISQNTYLLEEPLLNLSILVDSPSNERRELGDRLLAMLRQDSDQFTGDAIHRRINYALLKASQSQIESGSANFAILWFNGPIVWVARWGTTVVQLERGKELHSLFSAEDLEGDGRVRFLPDVVQVEFLTSDAFILGGIQRVSPPVLANIPRTTPPDLKIDALRHTELFRDLPFGDLSRLVTAATVQSFPSGTVLMQEGHPADSVHIVVEGTLKVEKRGSPAIECGFGTCLGERSLVFGEKRSATVTCLSPTITLQLDQKVFRELLEQDPRFGVRILLQLMKILTQRS